MRARQIRSAHLFGRERERSLLREWVAASYQLGQASEDRLAGFLARYSDGNPFFIAELLRMLEDDRLLVREGDRYRLEDLTGAGVPNLLRQVIEHQLERVSEETREMLSIGAVIGQRVDLDIWRRIAGAGEEAIESTIAEALQARLLVSGAHEAGVAFRHALIREALYQDTLPPRRQVWHRRAAEALLARPSQDPDEVAHHLRMAGDPRAVEWLIRAGDRAYREAYALHTAASRYALEQGLI